MANALARLVLNQMKAEETAKATRAPRVRTIATLIDELLTLGDNAEDRRDGKFHPSDLSKNFCPKAWALYNYHPKGKDVKAGSVEARGQRIFDNGHHLHARLQGYLTRRKDILFGTWSRVIGVDEEGKLTWKHKYNCFRPAGEGWQYREVKLVHDEDNILGHTDGLMKFDGYKDVLEIKSIRSDMFRWLADKPHDAHLIQGDIYLHCLAWQIEQMKKNTGPLMDAETWAFATKPVDGIWYLYENKDTQELKQYYVPNDPDRVAKTMLGLRGRMDAALDYLKTKKWPECTCPPKKKSALCKSGLK